MRAGWSHRSYQAIIRCANSNLGFPDCSDGKESTNNAGDLGLIPGSGKSLKKRMATHSSIPAWGIPWTEEPVGYNPWGCKVLDTTKQLTHNANSNLRFLSCLQASVKLVMYVLLSPSQEHSLKHSSLWPHSLVFTSSNVPSSFHHLGVALAFSPHHLSTFCNST